MTGQFLPRNAVGTQFGYICALPAFQEFGAGGQVDTRTGPAHELYVIGVD